MSERPHCSRCGFYFGAGAHLCSLELPEYPLMPDPKPKAEEFVGFARYLDLHPGYELPMLVVGNTVVEIGTPKGTTHMADEINSAFNSAVSSAVRKAVGEYRESVLQKIAEMNAEKTQKPMWFDYLPAIESLPLEPGK